MTILRNPKARHFLFCAVFTAACAAVNYFGAFLAARISFPLYLDSTLTIAVTAVCGLVPGIVCATATNLLSYFFIPNMGILFVLCHISTAVSAELFFWHERKKNMLENGRQFSYSTETFMWAGLVAGLTNSVLGNTFSYWFYPALKIPQAGTAVQEIYVVTRSLLFANYFGGTITNLIDKIISATVSLFVYRLVRHIKRRITMGGGRKYLLN